MTTDDLTTERRAVEAIAPYLLADESEKDAAAVKRRLRPILDAALDDLPIGEPLMDDEHDPPLGVVRKEVGGGRIVSFDAMPDDVIVYAARQGWVALNATAFDGGLASSDDRIAHYARQFKQYVRQGTVTKMFPLRGERQ